MIEPIATTVAGEEPDTAANSAQAMRHERTNRSEDGVHRTVAGRLRGDVLTIDVECQGRSLRTHRAGDYRERQHLDAIVGVRDFLVDQRFDIFVIDLLLAVG